MALHLKDLEATLRESRDRARSEAKLYPHNSDFHRGQASAFSLALAYLHIDTDGAYGERYEQRKG